jgi:hypothetical protein
VWEVPFRFNVEKKLSIIFNIAGLFLYLIELKANSMKLIKKLIRKFARRWASSIALTMDTLLYTYFFALSIENLNEGKYLSCILLAVFAAVTGDLILERIQKSKIGGDYGKVFK